MTLLVDFYRAASTISAYHFFVFLVSSHLGCPSRWAVGETVDKNRRKSTDFESFFFIFGLPTTFQRVGFGSHFILIFYLVLPSLTGFYELFMAFFTHTHTHTHTHTQTHHTHTRARGRRTGSVSCAGVPSVASPSPLRNRSEDSKISRRGR